MNSLNLHLIWCTTVFFFILLSCTQNLTGVETTNGARITVTAESIEGIVPPFANIEIFGLDYIPLVDSGFKMSTVADEKGAFFIQYIYSHSFNMILTNKDTTLAVFLPELSEGFSDSVTLRGTGSVSGEVKTRFSNPVLIYIPGTGYHSRLNSPEKFRLEGIAAGNYTVVAAHFFTARGAINLQQNRVYRQTAVHSSSESSVDTLIIENW